ncbi:XRE family transcriptional regulator [Caballeronia temeraria]|uniref:XRE family transcriptional regulator n=1 Tax=Caballeronia temeraria TaxID=1777137 RepID=A0A158CWZ2_9BURK|nr:RodZ domain-containing protein [Caballeronia temeraria]SAK86858.1 XRE family transcriptional regulator [Caballeronia temeraria]
MSEPQHPTPFGSHSDNRPGSHHDAQGGAEGAASNPGQTGNLDSIQAVGARLAQLRQAKAWSIDDVSARLKVSPQKLLALEAGDISHLPDRTFAAGIVRSYAKILGADPAPFTQAFRRDGGDIEQNLKVPASAGTGLPRARVSVPLGNSSGRKRSWIWGVLAIIVVLAALVMWHTGGDSSNWLARLKAATGLGLSSTSAPAAGSNESSGTTSAPTPDEAAAANTGEASLPEVAAAPGEQPMPRPLGTNALPASSSTLSAVQGASAPAAAAPASAAKGASAAKAASAVATAAAASAPAVAGSGSGAIELKVKEDSWFSVRGKDGKELFSGLVHAGSTQRVEGEAPFKVTVGNVKGVESLSVDDEPVDAKRYSSARGNVARLSLP